MSSLGKSAVELMWWTTTRSQTDGHHWGVECSGTCHVFPAYGQGVDQARGVHQARQAGEREFVVWAFSSRGGFELS
jgi:hypothetical protein